MDAVVPLGVDDLLLAAEQAPSGIDGDQERVVPSVTFSIRPGGSPSRPQ